MHPSAQLPLVLGGRGGEIQRRGQNPRQVQGIQFPAECLRLDKRCSDDGKGVRGSPALRAVGSLNQAGSGIEQGRFKPGNAHAGHDPGPAPVPESHFPVQSPAGHHLQVAVQPFFPVDHPGHFPAGQAIAHRKGVPAHKAVDFRLQDAALHPVSQGIGSVQHHQPLSCPGAVLQAVAKGGQEGIVPASHIRHIVHQGIKPGKQLLRQPLAVLGVQAAHRQTAEGVHLVGEQGSRRLVPPDTVLRRQQQAQIAHLSQDLNGGAVIPCPSRRSGQQGHPPQEQFRHLIQSVRAEQYHGHYLLDNPVKTGYSFKKTGKGNPRWNIRCKNSGLSPPGWWWG